MFIITWLLQTLRVLRFTVYTFANEDGTGDDCSYLIYDLWLFLFYRSIYHCQGFIIFEVQYLNVYIVFRWCCFLCCWPQLQLKSFLGAPATTTWDGRSIRWHLIIISLPQLNVPVLVTMAPPAPTLFESSGLCPRKVFAEYPSSKHDMFQGGQSWESSRSSCQVPEFGNSPVKFQPT